MIDIDRAIKSLSENAVEYVIVGGVAVAFHGSSYVTQDLDFCFARTKENLKKIVRALSPYKPRPRGFPENLPFVWDQRTVQNGTNFTLETEIGDIDLLGEIKGVGDYAAVENQSVVMRLYGFDVRILSIEGLIKAKRAAGRAKDLLVLPELEALREVLAEGGELNYGAGNKTGD